MKLAVPAAVVVVTFVLTLTVRLLIESITRVPLSTQAMAVIAAMWLLICLAVRWLWSRTRKKKGDPNDAVANAAGAKR